MTERIKNKPDVLSPFQTFYVRVPFARLLPFLNPSFRRVKIILKSESAMLYLSSGSSLMQDHFKILLLSWFKSRARDVTWEHPRKPFVGLLPTSRSRALRRRRCPWECRQAPKTCGYGMSCYHPRWYRRRCRIITAAGADTAIVIVSALPKPAMCGAIFFRVLVCIRVFEDSQGVLQLTQNPACTSNSKQIGVPYTFLREPMFRVEFDIILAKPERQHADFLIKSLCEETFCFTGIFS